MRCFRVDRASILFPVPRIVEIPVGGEEVPVFAQKESNIVVSSHKHERWLAHPDRADTPRLRDILARLWQDAS
jgi:hypothetical protein